ncbi:MAG: sigma 54-interacting transcriptional regulator [Tissierellaceae bacterium]|nr:sigma 54-interacting transcriptional regulator [Tissierellaceae bacterium]
MKDIVIIAPYKDLYILCKEIIEKNSYDDIDVLEGVLSPGLAMAQSAIDKGAKIIISRGGTYKLIKEKLSIPVLEMSISSFDLLRGFKNVKGYNGKIGVVGYGNIIHGSEVAAELLDLDITKIEIENDENAESIFKPFVDEGIDLFIGDTVAKSLSDKFNCKSYVIESGEDSILSSIKDARRVLMLSKIEQEKAEQMKTITDFVNDGIISIDENEKIVLINNTAKKLFNIEDNCLGEPVRDVVPQTKLHEVLKTGKAQLGELQELGLSTITTNRVPIIVNGKINGVVATFNDVTELQKLERSVRIKLSKKGFIAKYTFDDIIYSSDIMEESITKAKRYSPYDSPILINGKTGVGKELFAQGIHNYSNRSKGPFVAINCAALPPNLIESELFGYVEGAFTGANKNGKAGLFELAHAGTIFLDEISELPLELQGRLLRVLQEKEVMRIGDDKVIPIDVRILCATNKDLKKLIDDGKFREDLYYRINILSLRIPSLNERIEDMIVLTEYFVKKYSEKYNKRIKYINESLFEYLSQYDFKGNIRELEGIIERCVVLSTDEKLDWTHIDNSDVYTDNIEAEINKPEAPFFSIDKEMSLEELNKQYIKHIIDDNDGVINESANVLGINRSTLWRKLKEINDAE